MTALIPKNRLNCQIAYSELDKFAHQITVYYCHYRKTIMHSHSINKRYTL